MNPSMKTQLDIKNNAEEVKLFLSEMKTWEQEMKERDQKLKGKTPVETKGIPPPRSSQKKRQQPVTAVSAGKEKKRISAYDYQQWDKFDVEKACREIEGDSDNSDSSEGGNESDLPPLEKKKGSVSVKSSQSPEETKFEGIEGSNKEKLQSIDLAYFEKNLGNQFVKKENWKDAIECYTKAIELDPSNPIYYANRSLCHIKLTNFKFAEVDSTIALQLDKSYVKAYQRRAFARKALQQYKEAKCDYEQVLVFEPNNSLARAELTKIDEYLAKSTEEKNREEETTFDPKNIFKSIERPRQSAVSQGKAVTTQPMVHHLPSKKSESKEKEVSTSADPNQMLAVDEPCLLPKATVKVKQESEVLASPTLFTNRLPIGYVPIVPVFKEPHLRSKKSLKKIEIKQSDKNLEADALLASLTNIIPKASVVSNSQTENSSIASSTSAEDEKLELPPVPRTCVQFELAWMRVQKHEELSYRFLKSIPSNAVPSVFGSSLESGLLSQILFALTSDRCLDDPQFVFDFLTALAEVERFKSLVLFMTPEDHKGVEKCCNSLKEFINAEETAQLRNLYDL